jgi:hypothetical protein
MKEDPKSVGSLSGETTCRRDPTQKKKIGGKGIRIVAQKVVERERRLGKQIKNGKGELLVS